ncbi:hypothetical protein EVAR_36234_1 [Eumeta japonica]|uniref:Uncharacterized protein n=1 Tax=Eumeta variegata TaxID=151549 RepID=A0A4C1WVZ5_EUMVA|nr:hypothetical protein EVAR_36234_1 [Eumeta japonica]
MFTRLNTEADVKARMRDFLWNCRAFKSSASGLCVYEREIITKPIFRRAAAASDPPAAIKKPASVNRFDVDGPKARNGPVKILKGYSKARSSEVHDRRGPPRR